MIATAGRSMRAAKYCNLTPAQAALYGAVAGLVATGLVSVLARAVPGIRAQAFYRSSHPRRPVRETDPEHPAIVTPAGALAQAEGPGPEGSAGLFALKIASGLFGRDIARHVRLWGKVVHLAYGSFWGMLYGVLQGGRQRHPLANGSGYGTFVWALGPGWLVPAMKLMHPPTRTPPTQMLLNIFGHMIYGAAVAKLFDAQAKRRS